MISLAYVIVLVAVVNGLALNPDAMSNWLNKKSDMKVLKLDFDVERNHSLADLIKREPTAQLRNSRDIRYLMDIYLGSDKQKIRVDIDTGSSDLWVNQAGTGYTPFGTYNWTTSTTYSDSYAPFFISYADGTSAEGTWSSDTVALADGTSVESFSFALISSASNANVPPILGISRKTEESSLSSYDNFPYALVDAGIIEKPSYSIYLDGDRGETGVVLFGGIDEAKYSGELVSFPIVDSFYGSIELQTISVDGKEYPVNKHAQLDSGSSWLYLPKDVVLNIAELLGADTCEDCNNRRAPCDQPSDQFVTFDFGKQKISLSYADLLVRPINDECFLGAAIAPDNFNGNNLILGDVFLRHTYAYFDFENDVIAIAPSIDTEASNIVQA